MDNLITRQTVSTTCCYCGVGCGVSAEVENGQVVAVKGDSDHPANYGRLCVKGSSLHETQNSKERLLHPQVNGVQVSWDEALTKVAKKFSQVIDEHGPDAVAFYLSGQLLTEDYYVANKLMKGFLGTANVDTNSRLCMASAVVAHKRAFGGDLVPGCYEDLEKTDVLILVGSNMAYAHPIVYQRIVKAKELRPELKIVVLDPRRTATCEIADIHLALQGGSDAFFFNGLLSYIAQCGDIAEDFIADHCDGFEQALAAAQQQVPTIGDVARCCGVDEALIAQVFDWFVDHKKVVTVFSQGVNQSSSGVDKGNAIINCHLASGKIGYEGAAPFSITGQPNAMGGREVGGLANQLAAHMSFDNPEHIALVEKFWQAPRMARKEGLKAVDMFKAVSAGKIKAIWIMATNPVVSMPDANAVREALQGCELVVVSECVADTDTAKTADVLLPATTWSEKHGTVTNSERCISLQKGFLQAPGQARHDWQIMCDFAKKMGFTEAFNYSDQVEIFREHAALSGFENNGRRGFDISALQDIGREDYDNFSPVQWPVTESEPRGVKRLFSSGYFYTPNNRAKFIPIEARYPKSRAQSQQVVMNTGRIRDQWHTMSRTGVAAKLWGHTEEPFIDVHPEDIKNFELRPGGLAILKNRKASYIGRVRAEPGQRRGDVFVPMHWNDKFSRSSRADALVDDVVDPICGQPEFKHCAVDIEAFPEAWQGFLISQHDISPDLDYWAKMALGKGYKLRMAHAEREQDWLSWLQNAFEHIDDWLTVRDSQSHFWRCVGFDKGRLSVALMLSWGYEPAPESRWLESQMGELIEGPMRMALAAGQTPGEQTDVGKIICSCFQVGENTIAAAIAEGCEDTDALGEKLKCGTNCGSCIPELKTLIRKCDKAEVA